MNLHHLGLAVLMSYSFSSLGKVSIAEKENRVHFIEKIGHAAPSLSVEAFRRELEYEKQELSVEERARNEARLLAERVQEQIAIAYERALKEQGDANKALQIVKQAVNNDLKLAAPGFKEELLALSNKTLDGLYFGGVNNDVNLSNLERVILPSVEERAKILNEQSIDAIVPKTLKALEEKNIDDSSQLEFSSSKEFFENLLSDKPSTRWVSTSNQTINSSETTSTDANISYQVKIDFMGVSLEAGPQILFRREYSTVVNIMAEELTPIILSDGNFDTFKRDRKGKVIVKNGENQRRFTMSTRRVVVPDYVENKTVTLAYLAKLCHKNFLAAKLNENLTVSDSLNIMMKNVIAGLRFSHPKTKCAVDTHCIDWFNNEVIYLWKLGTYPRCFEEAREKYRACELRGLEGMSCKVYKNGALVSSGSWEIDCDKGLKCVQYQEASWRQFAKGKCEPINPSTYRDPKKYPEYPLARDYIEVDLVE